VRAEHPDIQVAAGVGIATGRGSEQHGQADAWLCRERVGERVVNGGHGPIIAFVKYSRGRRTQNLEAPPSSSELTEGPFSDPGHPDRPSDCVRLRTSCPMADGHSVV